MQDQETGSQLFCEISMILLKETIDSFVRGGLD